MDAAAEARDKALETGAKGVDAAKDLGTKSLDRANSVKGRLASGFAEQARRWRGNDEEG